MNSVRRALLRGVTGLLVAAALVPGVAFAQSRPPGDPPRPPPPVERPATGPVSIDVMCVRATKSNSRVDPELQPALIKQLSFTSYTGFDLVSRSEDSLAVGEEATVALEGGRRLRVELVDRDDTAARLRVRLLAPDGTKTLDTTVSVHRNRTFIVAGPRVGDDVLIIPVTARY